jgi:protein-S-isoprenylcysteine O-methyltransferase Ste14
MKQRFFVDSHKGVTWLAILILVAVYGQWDNATAWVYLALHGTYGILWVLKSRIFPDKSWENQISWGYGLANWGFLTLYWVAPWLLTSRQVQAPPWYLGICVSLFTLGVFLHFTADMQKYTSLKLQPGHLITEGMFARSRNMNYFGELLIYLGFGLLAMHWLPLAIIGVALAGVWLPNMLRKDKSLARYAEFEVYRQRSKRLIPFLF